VDAARYDMVAQCGAGCQPKLDLIMIHRRWWFDLVDFPLLRSQTRYNGSLAAVDADVDKARYDMVAQCGAGGQLKFAIMRLETL
jgi:hypothetical protein